MLSPAIGIGLARSGNPSVLAISRGGLFDEDCGERHRVLCLLIAYTLLVTAATCVIGYRELEPVLDSSGLDSAPQLIRLNDVHWYFSFGSAFACSSCLRIIFMR